MNESAFAWAIEQHHRANGEFLVFLDVSREIDLEPIDWLIIKCRSMDRTAFTAKRIAESIPA